MAIIKPNNNTIGGDTLTELQAKRTATKTKYPKSGA